MKRTGILNVLILYPLSLSSDFSAWFCIFPIKKYDSCCVECMGMAFDTDASYHEARISSISSFSSGWDNRFVRSKKGSFILIFIVIGAIMSSTFIDHDGYFH